MKNTVQDNLINIILDNKNIIDLFSNKKCQRCQFNLVKHNMNISNVYFNSSDIIDCNIQLYLKDIEVFYSIVELNMKTFYFNDFNLLKPSINKDMISSNKIKINRDYTLNLNKLSKIKSKELFKFTLSCAQCHNHIMNYKLYTNKFPEIYNRKLK